MKEYNNYYDQHDELCLWKNIIIITTSTMHRAYERRDIQIIVHKLDKNELLIVEHRLHCGKKKHIVSLFVQ